MTFSNMQQLELAEHSCKAMQTEWSLVKGLLYRIKS